MLFKLNMDILHPANRSSDSLTTCRSVQRSTGNDRGHYDINCENFSESTLNKNLLINYGSFALTMEEQRKLVKFFYLLLNINLKHKLDTLNKLKHKYTN